MAEKEYNPFGKWGSRAAFHKWRKEQAEAHKEESSRKELNRSLDWLKKRNLADCAEILTYEESAVLNKKLIDSFVDLSFMKDLVETYGQEEMSYYSVEELVGDAQNHFNKKLISMSEFGQTTNQEVHRKRVKGLVLNKKSLKGKKIYFWRFGGYRIEYEDLEKFIDGSVARDEYNIFDDTFTWCLSVNHEYGVMVVGDLLEKE